MGIYNRIEKKLKEVFIHPPPLMVAPVTAVLTSYYNWCVLPDTLLFQVHGSC